MKQALRIIGLILGGGILIYQGVGGISFLISSKIAPSIGWFIFSLLFSILAIAVQILCWTLIMRDLGASISFRQAMSGYVLNFLPRYIPGTVWGYLSRAEWLKKQYAVEYSTSYWGSIIEVLVGVYSSIFFICILLIYKLSLSSSILVIIGLIFLFISVMMALKIISSVPRLLKFTNPIYGLDTNLRILLVVFVLLAINWFNYGLIVYGSINTIFPQLVIDFNLAKWIHYSGLFSGSWLIGFLSWFFPAGLGVRDWALSQGLTLWSSIPNEAAYVIAILVRLLGVLSEIIWTIINLVSGGRNMVSIFGENTLKQ